MVKAARTKVAVARPQLPLLSRTIQRRICQLDGGLVSCQESLVLLEQRQGMPSSGRRMCLNERSKGHRDNGAGPGAIFWCHWDDVPISSAPCLVSGLKVKRWRLAPSSGVDRLGSACTVPGTLPAHSVPNGGGKTNREVVHAR